MIKRSIHLNGDLISALQSALEEVEDVLASKRQTKVCLKRRDEINALYEAIAEGNPLSINIGEKVFTRYAKKL